MIQECECGSTDVSRREEGVALVWMPKSTEYHCNKCGRTWH